jgi:hypothetical protein
MKTAMEHERIARVLGSRADAFTAFERAMLALSIAVEPHPLAAEVDQCRETLSGYLRVDIESLEGRLTPETVPALWALRRELMKVAASEPADHVNQAALTRFVYESSLIHLVIPTGQTDPERDLYTRFDEALEAARLPFLITHRTDDGGSIVRMVESRLNALATQVGLAPSMAVSPRVFVVGSEIATRGTPIREELEQFGYRVFEDYVRPVGRVRRESLDLLERELKPLLASLHSLHTELTADHQDKLQEREEWRNRQTAEEQVLVLANGIESAQQEFLNLLRRNELLAPLRSAQESLGTINGLRNALDVQLRATAQTRRANDEAELTSLQRVTEHRALISETRIRAIDTINNAIARFPQDVEARHIDMVARRSRHLLPVEARVRLHLTDTRNQQRIDLAVQADRRDYEATAVEEIPTSVVSAMVAQWMSNPDPSGAQEVLRLAVSRRSFGDAIRSLVEMLHESRERTGDGWRTLANKAAFYVLAKGTEEGWQDDHQTDLRAFEELSSELSRLIAAGPRP